jgi:hypothetical protein
MLVHGKTTNINEKERPKMYGTGEPRVMFAHISRALEAETDQIPHHPPAL